MQLDVSENNIETLDLSALNKLESVQCSRNQMVELKLNGKALTSLIAGNNSEYYFCLIFFPFCF
jgi:PH domain/leucine-rich repeat-containing protein phosphatase